MKHLLILFILLSLSINAYSMNYYLNNDRLSFCITAEEDFNVYTGNLYDRKTGTGFMTRPDPSKSLWSFEIKKYKDYAGNTLTLKPADAEKFECMPEKDRIVLYWHNVKKSDMASGFDVKCTVNLDNINSYWDIDIVKCEKTEDYGIWQVIYPVINSIYVPKGSKIMVPNLGGMFYDEWTRNDAYDYPSCACPIQLFTFQRGPVSLYFSTEDLSAGHKYLVAHNPKPETLEFFVKNNPDGMAVASEYHQAYKFNMAVIDGDWIDACKKYRKWGIENSFIPFEKGTVDKREDLPKWYKENPVWVMWSADKSEKIIDWIEETRDFLDMPLAVHLYGWSQFEYDTHYPAWMPEKSVIRKGLERFKDKDIYVMPYTNGHIADKGLSPYYKEHGDNLLSLNSKGEFYPAGYDHGESINSSCCPSGVYADCYYKETEKIFRELDFDALYMDQVSSVVSQDCFNPLHTEGENPVHSPGGGNRWAKDYYRLINKVKKNISEIKGKPVPITVESSAECYPFDGWLRCNESYSWLEDSYATALIFSGYMPQFGNYYYKSEFEKQNAQPAINKTAIALTVGYQPGWRLLNTENQFADYPYFGKYFKNMAKARQSAIEYFNYGELIRKVRITNDIPKEKIYLEHWAEKSEKEYDPVKTCTFNYKGKTMICFTSVSLDKTIKVEWEATPKDLYLKEKSLYRISEIYPNKETVSKGREIKSSFEIKPLETVLFVVE